MQCTTNVLTTLGVTACSLVVCCHEVRHVPCLWCEYLGTCMVTPDKMAWLTFLGRHCCPTEAGCTKTLLRFFAARVAHATPAQYRRRLSMATSGARKTSKTKPCVDRLLLVRSILTLALAVLHTFPTSLKFRPPRALGECMSPLLPLSVVKYPL